MANNINPLRKQARHGPREFDAEFERDLLEEEVALLSKRTMSTRSNAGIAKEKKFSDHASLALLCPSYDTPSCTSELPMRLNEKISGSDRDYSPGPSTDPRAEKDDTATEAQCVGATQEVGPQQVGQNDSNQDVKRPPPDPAREDAPSQETPLNIVQATIDRLPIQTTPLQPTPTRTESPFSLQNLLDSLPAVPPNPLPNPDRRPQLPLQQPFMFKANHAIVKTPALTENLDSPLHAARPFSINDARHIIENLIHKSSVQLADWHRTFAVNTGEFNIRLTRQGFRKRIEAWMVELTEVAEFLERGIVQKGWMVGMLWSVDDVRKILEVVEGIWSALMALGRGQAGLRFKDQVGGEMRKIERVLKAFEQGRPTARAIAKANSDGMVNLDPVEMSDKNVKLAQQAILAAEQKIAEELHASTKQYGKITESNTAPEVSSHKVNTTTAKDEENQLNPEATAFCPASNSDEDSEPHSHSGTESKTVECVVPPNTSDVDPEPKELQAKTEASDAEDVNDSYDSEECHYAKDFEEERDGVTASSNEFDSGFDPNDDEDRTEETMAQDDVESEDDSDSEDDEEGGVSLI
jgi:hypothetical protein